MFVSKITAIGETRADIISMLEEAVKEMKRGSDTGFKEDEASEVDFFIEETDDEG